MWSLTSTGKVRSEGFGAAFVLSTVVPLEFLVARVLILLIVAFNDVTAVLIMVIALLMVEIVATSACDFGCSADTTPFMVVTAEFTMAMALFIVGTKPSLSA